MAEQLDLLRGIPPEDIKVEKRLCSGGISEIWLATHALHPEPFVVKYSKMSAEGNNYVFGQFEREFEASAVRNKRGIKQAGTHISEFSVDVLYHPYLFVEYFQSVELGQIMVRCHEWARAKVILRCLMEKLNMIHRNGIVHRDIKPSNILVSSNGDLRLIDFSLATIDGQWHRYHEEGMALGTPLYMSPEQAYGKKMMLTSASDWYSVGVILYLWMTGKFPFHGKTSAETMRMHCYSPPPLPFKCNIHDAPQELADVCRALLTKEPNARFSAVNRFRDLIDADSDSDYL